MGNENEQPKIMQTLVLDYAEAIKTTEDIAKSIRGLNYDLSEMKKHAIHSTEAFNRAFSSKAIFSNLDKLKRVLEQIEKDRKPIEVKVITDEAEREIVKFAESVGAKLDRNLRKEIADISDSFYKGLTNEIPLNVFEEKAKNMVEGLTDAYAEAMDKYDKRMEREMFAESTDMKIYEFLRTQTIKLSHDTLDAKKNVEGFKEAIRGVMKQSEDTGLSLDMLGQEMSVVIPGIDWNIDKYSKYSGFEGMDYSDGATPDIVAERITKAVEAVREFRQGFEPAMSYSREQLKEFVDDNLFKLAEKLYDIEFRSRESAKALEEMGQAAPKQALEETASAAQVTAETLKKVSISAPEESLQDTIREFEILETTVGDFAIINRKTWEDAEGKIYKYTDTLKNLEKQIEVVDTYIKDDEDKFEYKGRTFDDRHIEASYKAIQKIHGEALKVNEQYDKWLDSVSETTLEHEKSRAAVIQQKTTAHDLNEEYSKQAGAIREQLKGFQDKLASQKKLTAEEVRQTEKMQEQLKVLESQQKTDIAVLKEQKQINQELDELFESKVKASELANMQARAASAQQKADAKGLSEEYITQFDSLRGQISVVQARLQMEGKLTDEEVLQTEELKEQLKLLEAQSRTAISDAGREVTGIRDEDDFGRMTSWLLASKAFYTVINASKQAVATIKEVERGIVDVQRVMSDSTFVFDEYRDKLLAFGVEYGQTFGVVQDVAMRWAQAGYNVKDSLELTETALIALNAAELNSQSATQGLIAIMAQWSLESNELIGLLDKITITADNYSLSSQDLVDGLVRSSGAARNLNMSLEDTISLLTVMREASGRTGQEVGNALNSILSYMQRTASINVFEKMGIQVFADSAKTQFRNIMDLFKDLAANWDNASDDIKDGFIEAAEQADLFGEEMAAALDMQDEWNDLQKRDVSQAAAGVFRRNYFIALINRFAKSQEVLNGMMEAEGYTMEKNAITMQTLEKQSMSLKASIEALAVAAGDAGLADSLKLVTKGGTSAINTFNKLPKPMKDVVIAMTTLTLATKALEFGLRRFKVIGADTVISFASLTSASGNLTTAFKTGTAAVGGFIKANAGLIGISALIGIFIALYNAKKKAREEAERFVAATKETIKNIEEQKQALIELSGEYDTLKAKEQNLTATTDEKERLKRVQEELVELYDVSITGITEEGKAYADSTRAIRDRIAALEEEEEAEKASLETAVLADDPKTIKGLKDTLSKIDKRNKEKEEIEKEIENLLDILGSGEEVKEWAEHTEEMAAMLLQQKRERAKAISQDLKNFNESIIKDTDDRKKYLTYHATETAKALSESGRIIDNEQRALITKVAQGLSKTTMGVEEAAKTIDKIAKEITSSHFVEIMEKYNKALAEGDTEALDEASKKIAVLTSDITKGNPELEFFVLLMAKLFPTSTQMAEGLNRASSTTFDLKENLKEMNEHAKASLSDLKLLDQAIHDVENGQALSVDTVLELIDAYDISSDSIEKVSGGYKIEISALRDLRDAKIKSTQETLENNVKVAESTCDMVKANIAAYGIEIAMLSDLVTARKAMIIKEDEYRRELGINIAGAAGHMGKFSGMYDNLAESINAVEEAEKKSKMYLDMLKDSSYGVSSSKTGGSSAQKQENKLLADSLKLLEHRKRISEETQDTIRAEITELKRINAEYVRTAEERMDMAERIYAAEKRLKDKTLQDSINWLNRMKALGQLSVEEEMAGWERVRTNQVDNIEAVRQAEENLYRLRNQLRAEAYSREESYIKHITKLGILSVEEQIDKYRELYTVKAESIAEEQSRVENLFSLYKSLLSDQQKTIKGAHDDRIRQIEDEARIKKEAQDEVIEGIEKELQLLDRREQEYDHDKRMADLHEELEYWKVRTSEQARKRVAELTKQIDEEEHKRTVALKRQSLEDEKKVAQDKIREIEDTAKKEKDKWESAYDEIEIIFDDHSTNMIALASAMSRGMYDAFKANYLDKIETALKKGDYDTAMDIAGDVPRYAQESFEKTYNAKDAQAKRLAMQIVNLKREYEYLGDYAAHERALPIYAELERMSPQIARMLHESDYLTAKKYVESLPEFHKGAKALSYGAAMFAPGELIFPSDLSARLDDLIAVLYQRPISRSSSILTDNRRDVRIDRLLNIEKNYMEDEVDSEILVRQLQRALSNM